MSYRSTRRAAIAPGVATALEERLSGGTPWADLRNQLLEKADGQAVSSEPWW